MSKIQTLTDGAGSRVDAHLIEDTLIVDGELVDRQYIEVYPAGSIEPDRLIGWYGSVESFMEAYSGAATRNW